MSRGIPALSTNQRNDPAPAATVTDAANGLSLSGTTAVLGQDVGDVANPALLTNNREIPVKTDTPAASVVLNDYNENVNPGNVEIGVALNTTGNESNGYVGGGNEGSGVFLKFSRFTATFTNDKNADAAPFPLVCAQGLTLGTDTHLYGDRVIDPGIGSKDLLHAGSTLSRALTYNFTVAAFTVNLPLGVAGYEYIIAVVSAGDVIIQPNAADCIRIAGAIGALGATATSNVVGSVVKLTHIGTPNGGNPTWLATSVVGTWVI